MTSSDRLDTTTIFLLILAAIVLLPLLTMGSGFGGTMGYGGMMGGEGYGNTWWPLVWLVYRLIFLLLVVGGGYLLFRRAADRRGAQDPAMEELRTAYARGDLSDEEFETRREHLDRER